MLTDIDMGNIFAQMQAAYGHQWAHKANAMPVWKGQLDRFSPNDVFDAVGKAMKTYPDFPPSLGQFIGMVEYSIPALPAPPGEKDRPFVDVSRVFDYTTPYDRVKNPRGNPHGIKLPNSTAQKSPTESDHEYESRIGSIVTLQMYPKLRSTRYA